MMLAEYRHIPTINGWATFLPPNWHLVHPLDRGTYLQQVESYASFYDVAGLCSFDFADRTCASWTPRARIDFLAAQSAPPTLADAPCTGSYDVARLTSHKSVEVIDLQGWITADPRRPDDPGDIAFLVRAPGTPGRLYPSARVSRPDVASALGNPHLLHSGFQAFVPVPKERDATILPVLNSGVDIVRCANLPVERRN